MDTAFGFDPQLPALPLAFDLSAVARLFQEHWPEPDPVVIKKCRLQDTKYQPATRCVTVYELRGERPDGRPCDTIGVVEITPAGVAHRLYGEDARLPWLAPATDPEGMRERFAGLPALAAPPAACTITPVRYKPGARCVFRYDLDGPAGRQVFFGKLLAQDADRLMATIGALHTASLAAPAMPRIPVPLAYWPEVRMLVQPAVASGEELNTRAFDPDEDQEVRARWLHNAGARLAALHECRSVEGPRRTLAGDLDELDEYIAPMAIVNPALAARYEGMLERLVGQAHGLAEPELVPSHGTFRTDQFMIEDGALVMIDLDSFCWSDPARDLGNFLGYLRWKAIRRPEQAGFIAQAGRLLLEGYTSARSAPEERTQALYEAATMLKIAGRRYRSLTVKEWPLVPALLDAAGAAVQ